MAIPDLPITQSLPLPSLADDTKESNNQDVRLYVPAEPRPPLAVLLPMGTIIKDKQDNEIGIMIGPASAEYDKNGEPIPAKDLKVIVVPIDNLDQATIDKIHELLAQEKADAEAESSKVNW